MNEITMKVQFIVCSGEPEAVYVDDKVGASLDIGAVATRAGADPDEVTIEEYEVTDETLQRFYRTVSKE